jgi:uncharacterized protein YbjT (DUF2867 family)
MDRAPDQLADVKRLEKPSSRPGGAGRGSSVELRARRAWVAGGTGLIGRSLLPMLLASQRYSEVHALVRSQSTALPSSIKLHRHRVDFQALSTVTSRSIAAADDAFILLGTTLKQAGSPEAFRRVDFDAVVATARAARVAGATRLAVVSAMGADKASRVLYNRVKGEMEQAVAGLGFELVVLARPSLLVGDRRALEQPPRPAEEWALRLLGPIMGWLPDRIRPIDAKVVARALMQAMLFGRPGVHVLSSARLQEIGS